jgi:hypothetical protein
VPLFEEVAPSMSDAVLVYLVIRILNDSSCSSRQFAFASSRHPSWPNWLLPAMCKSNQINLNNALAYSQVLEDLPDERSDLIGS